MMKFHILPNIYFSIVNIYITFSNQIISDYYSININDYIINMIIIHIHLYLYYVIFLMI